MRVASFSFGAAYINNVRSGGAASPAPAVVADTGASAMLPADLDGDVAQHLRKLTKRDATTKVKALQVRQIVDLAICMRKGTHAQSKSNAGHHPKRRAERCKLL